MSAIVNNSTAIGSSSASTTLETGSFSVGGTNRVLYALVGSGANSPSNPSAVKWGGSSGASMTQLGATITVALNVKVSLFRLIDPTSQTSTIHATWAGTDDERWIIGVAVEDADQTTPNGTVATNTGSTSNAVTVDAVSASGNLVLDFASHLSGGGGGKTHTVGANQTQLQNIAGGAFSAYEGASSSSEIASGTATTMSWTLSDFIEWATFAFAVNAAAAGGSSTLMGQAVM
jgi:hypothetical protein